MLKLRAYAELKKRILRGRLRPGALLSERRLAQDLGMSNTPLRWAVERLETEGFIEISPQRGFLVRQLSLDEIADHYESREVVEAAVVRRIAGRLDAAQVAELERNLAKQERSLDSGRVIEQVELDGMFHLLLCRFLGNEDLTRFMVQLRDRIFRVILQVVENDPARPAESYVEHRRIAQALFDGDGELAARIVLDHLAKGRASILPPSDAVPPRDAVPPSDA